MSVNIIIQAPVDIDKLFSLSNILLFFSRIHDSIRCSPPISLNRFLASHASSTPIIETFFFFARAITWHLSSGSNIPYQELVWRAVCVRVCVGEGVCVCLCVGWGWPSRRVFQGGSRCFFKVRIAWEGPESEGVIPTTHQMDQGGESLSEVVPAYYHAHTHTHTRLCGVKGRDCPALYTTRGDINTWAYSSTRFPKLSTWTMTLNSFGHLLCPKTLARLLWLHMEIGVTGVNKCAAEHVWALWHDCIHDISSLWLYLMGRRWLAVSLTLTFVCADAPLSRVPDGWVVSGCVAVDQETTNKNLT